MKRTLLLIATLPLVALADVEPVAPVVTPQESPKTITEAHIKNSIAPSVELRLKPSLTAPVTYKASVNDFADAQDTGIVADGMKWMSVERPVTLTGFVDKSAIDKNLDIAAGTLVWANEDKTVQLTTIDNPSAARLLEADRMGKVEVKEPRVLYYGVPATTEAAPMPALSDTPAPATERQQNMAPSHGNLRTIEGTLKKSTFGNRFSLIDSQGQHICRIDPKSPIDPLTLERYEGRTAGFVGVLHDNNGVLVLTVRSIRMR